jgi:hypothetical protein
MPSEFVGGMHAKAFHDRPASYKKQELFEPIKMLKEH